MTLHVFDETQVTQYSEAGTFTEPLNIIKNGTVSNTMTTLLYLNNNDAGGAPANAFHTVTIKASPDSKIGETSLLGWRMKVLTGINGAPTESDWDAVTGGNTLAFTDPAAVAYNGALGAPYTSSPAVVPMDQTYFFPFYVRLYIPAGTTVQQTRVVKLQIDSTAV